MIAFVFSMLGPRFTEEQSGLFRDRAEWRVINMRNGRMLVDGIGEASDLGPVLDALNTMGRSPIAIGAWEMDGTPLDGYALNEAAWLEVAPDLFDNADPENPVPYRPTEWSDIHGWAGWGEKRLA